MGDAQTISWSVLTHEHRDRSTDWYWAVGLLTVVGIIASIYFGNVLLALILAVGVGSILFLSIRGPREHDVTLGPRGVEVDGTLYKYPSIRSFWVSIEHPEDDTYEARARLFLALPGVLNPHVLIPLDDVDHAEAVRDYLLNYLEEEEQGPHFAEHLAELIGM